MSLKSALEALKRKDFATVRSLMAAEDPKSLTIQHYQIKGLAELSQSDWAAARDTFTAATARFPAYAAFWLNRGLAEENLGLYDAAIISHEHCLTINEAQVESLGNLANLYRRKHRYAESESMARKALEHGINKSDGLNILSLALIKQGKYEEADVTLRQAQVENPNSPMVAANRANVLVDKLDFLEAWREFEKARRLKDEPVYRRDEGIARLLSGDYIRGLPLYEARLQLPGALRVKPACPIWKGEHLNGKKLLIVSEQGFGDVIQFSRYQQRLTEGELVWSVPQELLRLLTDALRGTVLSEKDRLPACDYYIPIMSLPYVLSTIRPETGIVKLTAPETPKLPEGTHKNKIGLIWAGSLTNERDRERSIPLSLFEPMLKAIDADWYAPFVGDALKEIGTLPITRLDHLITDFADGAALIKQMNYIVSVDTSPAHLAGTLGVKTLLMLAYCPDWRWGTRDEKTPWYPSMRLMRQPKHGDWESAIKQATELLKRGF